MIQAVIDGKIAIIHIEKNLITENADLLDEKIANIRKNSVSNFIFDFHNIEFMCSSALGILAKTIREVSENNGKIYFCSLSGQLKKLFEATKFLSVVSVADNSKEAVTELNKKS